LLICLRAVHVAILFYGATLANITLLPMLSGKCAIPIPLSFVACMACPCKDHNLNGSLQAIGAPTIAKCKIFLGN
jgi:hypothetical protein